MASKTEEQQQQQQQQQLRIYLHSEISTAHSQHGISPHEDYTQYSSYCSRRLQRLRHTKLVRRELLHVRLYKSSLSTKAAVVAKEGDGGGTTTSGGGGGGGSKAKNAYRAIDLTNLPSTQLSSHINYFLEPLYCAERCWSQSMALKVEMMNNTNAASSDNNGGGAKLGGNASPRSNWSNGKFRAQLMKKLKKAVGYANLLETLVMSTKRVSSSDNNDNNNEEEKEEEEGGKEGNDVVQQPPVDEHTQMEARAYASFMRGNLALEMNQWQTACNEYQMALSLCEALGSTGPTNDDNSATNDGGVDVQQLELFDFFTTRAKNVIAPLLKYCHYELQEKGLSPTEKISFLQSSSSTISDHASDPLQAKLHSLKNETLQNEVTSGSSMSQIMFRENVIQVETRELRMAFLKIQDLKSDWEGEEEEKENEGSDGDGDGGNAKTNDSKSDAKFMELLSGYDDAISLTNQELKQLANLKSGPAVNAKKFQLINLMGYSKYQKLKLVMGRNEKLTNSIIQRSSEEDGGEGGMTLKHLEEVTHLYDALLQDARAIASLPGGGSPDDFDGDSSSAPVEDEFYLEANANVLRLRSLRCYYLARMHASPLVHKYSEAVALLDQAESLANEALEEIGACDQMENGDTLLENLEKVSSEMRGEKCRVLALSYLSKSSSSSSGKCLLQRLQDINMPSSPTSVSHVPPKLEPMACKPSFFDVALNYVSEYPVDELDRAMEEYNGAETAAGSGILGWFRRG